MFDLAELADGPPAVQGRLADGHIGLLCDRVHDPAARVHQLVEHHRGRLDATEAALAAEPRSAYEVSPAVFGAELSAAARRLAVAETLSHLVRLADEGRAEAVRHGGRAAWRAA